MSTYTYDNSLQFVKKNAIQEKFHEKEQIVSQECPQIPINIYKT